MAKKHIRILSINGGGIRGYIPALILDQISKKSGKNVTDLFDIAIGNSAGGMLSAIYATPRDLSNPLLGPKYNTTEILDLMAEARAINFPQDQIRNQLAQAKYPRDGIDSFLAKEMTINGTAVLLKDTLIPVTVVALNEQNKKPMLWSSCSKQLSEYALADAVGATTAAPTYFPPKEIKVKQNISTNDCSKYGMVTYADGCYYRLIDGGLFANSPATLSVQILRDKILNKTTLECNHQHNVFQNTTLPWHDFDLKSYFGNRSVETTSLSLNDETTVTIVELGTGKFDTDHQSPDLSKVNNYLYTTMILSYLTSFGLIITSAALIMGQ